MLSLEVAPAGCGILHKNRIYKYRHDHLQKSKWEDLTMAIGQEHHYLTTTNTFTRISSAGASVHDKKTFKLIKFIGEMGGGHNKNLEMAAVASAVLADTDCVKRI